MFTSDELMELLGTQQLLIEKSKHFLLENRLKINISEEFSSEDIKIMNYLSSLVLGGIALDDGELSEWRKIASVAADFEYTLFLLNFSMEDSTRKDRHIRRACILYEVAQVPGISSTLANNSEFYSQIKHFFTRDRLSNFGKLSTVSKEYSRVGDEFSEESTKALDGILYLLGNFLQNNKEKTLADIELATRIFKEASMKYQLEINADEISVFKKIITEREKSALTNHVDRNVLRKAKVSGLPAELWPMQQKALSNGVLEFSHQSWGLAAPTGTGKTSIAQLLLISFFEKYPSKKAFYIVPSRALASQIANDLLTVLEPLGKKVGALGSHLTYNEMVFGSPEEMDVLIFTPEKADLLLRIEPALLLQTRLVIVDEAHHIESGTRGILLEFYLKRLRLLVPNDCEIIQLSAVAPNIKEMVDWLGESQLTNYVKHDWRTGRFRIGNYERDESARGILQFEDCKPLTLFDEGIVDTDPTISLAQLAYDISRTGIVLVLVSSKAQAEKLANLVSEMRENNKFPERNSDNDYTMECLDARLERELYAEISLRRTVKYGIAYHHGGLPSRVRLSIEEAIKERKIDIVFATTTLAEGVNFPFSTVIVESLIIGRDTTLSPRGLWNIAGRAGRFGVDMEGHCILFRPSLWVDRLKGYKFEDYLNNKLDGIPPVDSAFANGIKQLSRLLDRNTISYNDLDKLSLQEGLIALPREDKKVITGLINLIRVGLTHAHANRITDVRDLDKSTFIENLFATSKMDAETKVVASKVEKIQRKVIRDSLVNDDQLLKIAARIGWTIETQSLLVAWIKGLQDWEIEKYGKIVLYGQVGSGVNLNSLLYPIAERMTEFEGSKLGGFTAYIASHWIEGHTLSTIRVNSTQAGREPREFSNLIDIIYSRIQYLLPWALFGVSELLELEARIRKIHFGSGVKDLSILSSEGVPNFDALTLVLSLNIERVDATRLAHSYRNKRRESDIIDWFKGIPWSTIAGIVSGQDRRRIDPELKVIHDQLNLNDT